MNKLDMRDISIIDAMPSLSMIQQKAVILNVGCGNGRIDHHIGQMGYRVYATDVSVKDEFLNTSFPNLTFHKSDIFDLSSFPIQNPDIVICSEVLEHLKDYKTALNNLLHITSNRLIITVPFEKSFNNELPPPEGHCNYWSQHEVHGYKDIHEFEDLCWPYSVSISKIRTKPKDVDMRQYAFLIIVDKKQYLNL